MAIKNTMKINRLFLKVVVMLHFTGSSFLLFLGTYVVGLYFGWVGLSLLSLWISLEVVMLGSIPLLKGETMETSSGSMVYFITQVFGGILILLGSLIVNSALSSDVYSLLGGFLIIGGCFMKIGAYPSYWWVSRCMGQLDWFGCFLVSCPAKVIPLYVIGNVSSLPFVEDWVELGAIFTTISGVVLGMSVRDFRVLYGYSSIIHSSSMMLISMCSFKAMGAYLFLYSIVCGGFVLSLEWFGVKKASDVYKFGSVDKSSFIFIGGLYCFSLAGLPPFVGFVLKYFLIKTCFFWYPLSTSYVAVVGFFSTRFYYKIFTNISSSAWVGIHSFGKGQTKYKNGFFYFICLSINIMPSFVFFNLMDYVSYM